MASISVTPLSLVAVMLIALAFAWRLFRQATLLEQRLHHADKIVTETLKSSEFQNLACDKASDGIIIQDEDGLILWCNPAYLRLHQRPAQDILGRNPREFALPDHEASSAPSVEDLPFDILSDELNVFQNQRPNGELFWVQINVSFHRASNERKTAVAVCRDITATIEQNKTLHDMNRQLQHKTTHDGLTAVHNRAAFLQFFEAALTRDAQAPVGLLHLDIINFKSINDRHGRSAGDAVLLHMAKILETTIQPPDFVGRIGGNEFIVACPKGSDLNALNDLAHALNAALADPFEWSNRVLQFDVSIGAAVSNTDTTAEDLLIRADFALSEAKRDRKIVVYDDKLLERHKTKIVRASELADAIDTGALDYFFQPQMDLKTGKIVGFETLVRWIHPEDGVIPPDSFLPLTQDLGLMAELDFLSMTAALTEKRRLQEAGFDGIELAFNASPEMLAHPDFINRLVWGVEAAGIQRSQIAIEVLETADFGHAADQQSNAAIIRDLRDAGFNIHLDDFGVGFAGLSHLATLDMTGVKIDRGMVTNILTDDVSYKIVRKIIELSNDLGLIVVAEGIEDQATSDALLDMGCDIIQGYWLGRPMPRHDLYDWLSARTQTPPARSA